MFKSILFATTAGSDCDDAASYAFDLAMKYNAPLFVFHVCGLPGRGASHSIIDIKTGETVSYDQGAYEERVIEEVRERYSDLLDSYGNVEIRCTIGDPSIEILRRLKKDNHDLIIMGAHRQVADAKAVRYRNVTGDTLQRVARSAGCPVLIISRPYAKNLWDLRHILCGTDLTKASMPAFRFALKFARENKARLHVFHTLDLTSGRPGKALTQPEIESRLDEARSKMESLYRSELGGYPDVELVVWEGIPYVEILKYARENAVELIAMSHHAGSIFQKKDYLGSTTEEVVLRSACPVVSVNRLEVLEDFSVFQI
jgi:nucleotide-binding universal stress UspA family protein